MHFVACNLRPARAGALCALVVLTVFAGHPALAANAPMRDIVAAVLKSGKAAQLPPHLSLVLGLGDGSAPIAVRQAVLRDGATVRVFDVTTAESPAVVMLRTNERDQTTRAWLMAANGKPLQAVAYHAGDEPRRTPPKQAATEAAAELQFWTGLRNRGATARPGR